MKPKLILEETIKDLNEFNLSSEKHNYVVKLGKFVNSQKLIFIIEDLNDTKNEYKAGFSLEELRSLNKLFRIFDSIDEVYN